MPGLKVTNPMPSKAAPAVRTVTKTAVKEVEVVRWQTRIKEVQVVKYVKTPVYVESGAEKHLIAAVAALIVILCVVSSFAI